MRWPGRALLLLLALVAAGCARAPGPSADTGAGAAAKEYYAALVRKDWQGAYAKLHREQRARWSLDQFAGLAKNHRRGFGFEPQEVHVRACEEQADQAIAHVVIKGPAGARPRSYKDAITLRRDGDGWGVVVPPRYGQAR